MAVIPGRTVLAAVTMLGLVAFAGCGKDSKKPNAASASSSSFSSSAAPTSTSSFSASSSTESAPPASSGPCSGAAVPGSAVNVTSAHGDFDGDGSNDTLTVYGTGSTSQPSPYHVHMDLGGGNGSVDAAIVDAATDSAQVVKALGGAEISASAGLPPDGSGVEAFVAIGSGASDTLVGVFQLTSCTLNRLTGPQGNAPSNFPIGGSVTHLDGLRCDGSAGGQRLVVMSATSDDGFTYQTKETRLEVAGGHFTPDPPVTDTIDAQDPRLQAFSSLDCQGVQAP
ncbi:MAG TPA: hypothetical protein VFV00_12005 [Acidimicrobiales bacterium]|nr:hypothetical protein [Acidimicrobiales bacterium]